jgi:hypothetical protein
LPTAELEALALGGNPESPVEALWNLLVETKTFCWCAVDVDTVEGPEDVLQRLSMSYQRKLGPGLAVSYLLLAGPKWGVRLPFPDFTLHIPRLVHLGAVLTDERRDGNRILRYATWAWVHLALRQPVNACVE